MNSSATLCITTKIYDYLTPVDRDSSTLSTVNGHVFPCMLCPPLQQTQAYDALANSSVLHYYRFESQFLFPFTYLHGHFITLVSSKINYGTSLDGRQHKLTEHLSLIEKGL